MSSRKGGGNSNRKLDQAWGCTEPHRDEHTSHDDDL